MEKDGILVSYSFPFSHCSWGEHKYERHMITTHTHFFSSFPDPAGLGILIFVIFFYRPKEFPKQDLLSSRGDGDDEEDTEGEEEEDKDVGWDRIRYSDDEGEREEEEKEKEGRE